jgi:hypothetical protein
MANILAFALIALLPSNSTTSDVPVKNVSVAEILAAGPEWQSKYDAYEPDPRLIEAVKTKLGSDLRIDVYLGLWCPDSRNNVPAFLKILSQLGSPVPVRYISVYRKVVPGAKFYVERADVQRVPTFIFFRGDKEIGRIVENPRAGMLEDFAEIVSN